MIRHTSTRRTETVSDAVGCLRVFGSVFVIAGTGALSVAMLGLGGMDSESLGARGVVALIGAAHLAGGLWAGWGQWTRTVAQRGGLKITERRPLRRSAYRHLAPSEVRDLLVLGEQDSDGDDWFALVAFLHTGERVRLTRHATPSREQAEHIRASILKRLGVPASGAVARAVACQRPQQEATPEATFRKAEPLAASRRSRESLLR